MTGARKTLLFSMAAGLVLAMTAGSGSASERETTIEGLEKLAAAAQDDSVRVRVNDGSGTVLRIGDGIVYHFESDEPGYLVAIHVNTHGEMMLLYPRAEAGSGRIGAGQTISFPGAADDFELEIQPPIGRDVVYAFVTDAPIERRDLGIDTDEIVSAFEPQQVPAFVARLRRQLESNGIGAYRARQIAQQIDGRGEVKITEEDIVTFFCLRTRSIAPPKLDLQIQFATDSAELDRDARRNIDEFAAALEDPRLRAMRFAVAGHTDETGEADYNVDLSRRRAQSVQDYLIRSRGIDPTRLEIEAHGERVPLIEEDSAYARQMNRRVEFTPIRE